MTINFSWTIKNEELEKAIKVIIEQLINPEHTAFGLKILDIIEDLETDQNEILN